MFIRGLYLNKSLYTTADFVPVTQIFANAFIYPHVTYKVISKRQISCRFHFRRKNCKELQSLSMGQIWLIIPTQADNPMALLFQRNFVEIQAKHLLLSQLFFL